MQSLMANLVIMKSVRQLAKTLAFCREACYNQRNIVGGEPSFS